MRYSKIALAASGVLCLLTSPATAAKITYAVDQAIGLGSVTGTIQTDGTFGSLAAANILAFDLLLGAPGAAIELTQMDSVVVATGLNLSADSSGLFFDYSGSADYTLFQLGRFGTGKNYYCNSSVASASF